MITIESGSRTPPYEQIRSQIAAQIDDRTLVVGARLPTMRALAEELGLALNTVARAYRALEDAGLIETRGRLGSFVAPGGDPTRAAMRRSADEYAWLAHRLGVARDEALHIIDAALG